MRSIMTLVTGDSQVFSARALRNVFRCLAVVGAPVLVAGLVFGAGHAAGELSSNLVFGSLIKQRPDRRWPPLHRL